MSKQEREKWMELSQSCINGFTDEEWKDYQERRCMCAAWNEDECICGAWNTELKEDKDEL